MRERQEAINLIQLACTNGARQNKACELLGISARTYQRWCHVNNLLDKRQQVRKQPANKLTEIERQKILTLANSAPYADLPPCQIVPRLADLGNYIASESTFYRVLREANQLQHRGRTKPKSHRRPRELVATGSNQVWSWDISYLATRVFGLFYYLYFVIDIFSRKIVGWAVHEQESSEYASLLLRDICQTEHILPDQVTLHSDNGAPMKGATLLATLQALGVSTSFSRPAVSNDNPYSESAFRTAKYCCFYPEKPFASINAAREWVAGFVTWYNHEHYHSGLNFITPEQRHTGKANAILKNRKHVYHRAKQQHPERWSGNIRNWNLPQEVILNPSNTTRQNETNDKKQNLMAA